MDDQHEPPILPRGVDRVADARRRLDELSRRASQPSAEQATYDKVKRLAQVVSTLTLTVSRLADELLGEQAPDNPADPTR